MIHPIPILKETSELCICCWCGVVLSHMMQIYVEVSPRFKVWAQIDGGGIRVGFLPHFTDGGAQHLCSSAGKYAKETNWPSTARGRNSFSYSFNYSFNWLLLTVVALQEDCTAVLRKLVKAAALAAVDCLFLGLSSDKLDKVVDLDIATSAFVARRFDMSRSGTGYSRKRAMLASRVRQRNRGWRVVEQP